MTTSKSRAAIWARVSTGQQATANQRPALETEAQRRGLQIVRTWEFDASAWRGDHRSELAELYAAAQRHEFSVLLLWSLDRLTREGPLETLQAVHRLSQAGVSIVSLQEPWVEASGELRDLLLALVGWVARWESQRRSERTKAGLVRALKQGKRLGRPPGARDRHQRRRSGYFARYADRGSK